VVFQEPSCATQRLPQCSVHGLAGHSDLWPPLPHSADTRKPAERPHFLLPVKDGTNLLTCATVERIFNRHDANARAVLIGLPLLTIVTTKKDPVTLLWQKLELKAIQDAFSFKYFSSKKSDSPGCWLIIQTGSVTNSRPTSASAVPCVPKIIRQRFSGVFKDLKPLWTAQWISDWLTGTHKKRIFYEKILHFDSGIEQQYRTLQNFLSIYG